MNNYLIVALIGSGFFLAVLLLLTAKPTLSRWLTAICGSLSVLGGLLLYGFCYLELLSSVPVAAVRTLFSVCRMFIGEIDFSDVGDASVFAHRWVVVLFWILHLFAIYTTSSAAISVIGASALKKAKLWLTRRKDLNLIYGVNENSVRFGQELLGSQNALVVYVDENPEVLLSDTIASSGCVLRTDPRAGRGERKFLRSIGIRKGSRKIHVFALETDYTKNILYAKALLASFRECGLEPSQLSLVIHARDDLSTRHLQVEQERYGYGFVTVYQTQDLVCRLLIQKYPPCRHIGFDHQGSATEDFEALIIGFGQIGQSALRSLVMNGQFVGSNFRADVFSPDCQEANGYFINSFPGIFNHYRIHFHPHDGRSKELYDHLAARRNKVKYIVISTGSEKRNDEIAEELSSFTGRMGVQIPIYRCSSMGVKAICQQTGETVVHTVYHPDVLSTQTLDRMAMLVNQHYQGAASQGALEDWMGCDYFSRMSCRAFADYMEAVLCAAGKTRQEAVSGDWQLPESLLENLSKMEHLRWCAFHFAMGFLPMTPEEYDQRTSTYREQVEKTGKGSIRIGKNMAAGTHACLIDWDELDALSAKETQITGKAVNYKQMDTENILLLPKLLQAQDK